MKSESIKNSRLRYLVFCLPFALAYVSWMLFPAIAQSIVGYLLKYAVTEPANWLWLVLVRFFYAWYTFLAIGVAGVWAIAATIARTRHKAVVRRGHPMVSFVVPAFNEEKNIPRCIGSLFECAQKYGGLCQIIVVDDGSRDFTYEIAWSAIELGRRKRPDVRGKVVRHSANLGKVEAIRTGAVQALGSVIVVVDADSWWLPDTLEKLVDHMLMDGKKAVTGYVHPSDGASELNPYVVLQQLEYSQGLGMNRCAQSLTDSVLVVSGAIGMFEADLLRRILNEKSVRSVTEDLEITLEMHKRGAKVGYVSVAACSTVVPESFNVLWSQRLRWFTGWLHNAIGIHRDLLLKKTWLTALLWYCYIFEYVGAFIDMTALVSTPFLFLFAPDRIYFVLNLLVFVPYGLLIGVANQAIALKYAYGSHNYRSLLFYTPFYPILRLVNILARVTCSLKFLQGDRGNWHGKIGKVA